MCSSDLFPFANITGNRMDAFPFALFILETCFLQIYHSASSLLRGAIFKLHGAEGQRERGKNDHDNVFLRHSYIKIRGALPVKRISFHQRGSRKFFGCPHASKQQWNNEILYRFYGMRDCISKRNGNSFDPHCRRDDIKIVFYGRKVTDHNDKTQDYPFVKIYAVPAYPIFRGGTDRRKYCFDARPPERLCRNRHRPKRLLRSRGR